MRIFFTLRSSAALLLFIALSFPAKAADTLRVLFIGNSYTAVNNLPQVFKDMAASTGQVIITDESTPGGYTFQQHSTNATTLNKISAGNWDYVVLQEQSQYPSFPDAQVATEVFPYAHILDSLVKAQNPCAQTVFYMTWGRKNGDAMNCPGWPPVCTYLGMDSLLRLRYIQMAAANGGVVSPAGAVWRYLRATAPGIELYSGDESHPVMAGTYAAGCAFYAALLRKDPTEITYTGGLSATVANQIKAAAKTVAFDSLNFWRQYVTDPSAAFTVSGDLADFTFTNTSANADSYQWFFGDGSSSVLENPSHAYTADGAYEVMLVASHCQVRDTAWQTVVVNAPSGISGPQASAFSLVQEGKTLWLQRSGGFGTGARISLFHLSGQKVAVQEISGGSTRTGIDISTLPAGMYVAVIVGKDGWQQTLKVSLR